VSSGFTGESTEFIVTNLGNYGCRACGYPVYSPQEDGPRCDGCKRFVLKDERAFWPEVLGLRARLGEEALSTDAAPQEPLTMRKLEAAMDAWSQPAPPEPEPLTGDRIAALVAPTLHELAQLLWAEKARLDGLVREKAMSPAVAREHLYQLREAARKRLAGRAPTPPRHQPTADPSSHPDNWSPPPGEQPPSPSELNAADVLAGVEEILRKAKS
jgi:hypothetical protein